MNNKLFGPALLGALMLVSNPAAAGIVWMTGWDDNTGNTRLLGFDEESGEQVHSIEGEAIIAADVCDKTDTVYFLDLFTLKAADTNGNVTVIADGLGHDFSGVTEVKVGQRYCTVWAYAIGNTTYHIIRNPGTSEQIRIDNNAFDYIEAADIDDSNDDLWIAQYNGRVYRLSKKTGLRSWRIESQGDFSVRDIAVGNGIVHVMRHDGLAGYLSTTRRDNVQQVYFDTAYQDYHDPNAYFSYDRVMTNAAGDPVVNVVNFYADGGFRATSDVLRMTLDLDVGGLVPGDHFVPFEDLTGEFDRNHSELVAAGDRNLWVFNHDKLRLLDASGVTLREIDYEQVHDSIMAYNVAY